ncbi:hypothetical protein [Algoriphagus sediminis]|uniref:DUF4252 domain-containing protein n=1 Tax=Algoriphagus sediminis TaxID=3057113 RepID=A0ABT7YD34_9BACT|nr:hypothetical protein [Algoriphagus sediminis]MDN3204421.1 hypothetical protein [Algoriphagus sediminis]
MKTKFNIKVFRKMPVFVLFMVMASCSDKSPIVKDLHISLGTLSTEDILLDYFTFSDSIRTKAIPTYNSLFQKIKDNISQGSFEVMKYKRARKKWADVAQVNPSEDQSKLVVVKYANGEYLYVKCNGNKIESMITVRKGDLISGWL